MQKSFFRNKFGEDIFNHKYRHEGCETWDKLADVLVEDVCRDKMSRGEKEHLKLLITEMKFIPGGRYLYYAGRPFKAFNNCLSGDTNVLTDSGWVSLKSSVGKTLNVLSPVDGNYYPATFHNHGKQALNRITFCSFRGHQNHTWEVKATRTHHWPLIDGSDTYDLRVGDVVPANTFSAGFDSAGFAHGFVFGDGNRNGQLRLCAEKDKKYLELLSSEGTVTYPDSANGDPCLYFGYKKEKWKELPENKSVEYIASFIRGWIAADGGAGKLFSVKKENLEWFRKHAAFAGLVITGELRSQTRDVDLGGKVYEGHEIFMQNFQEGENFYGFKVVKIEFCGEDEVYCPYEPVHQRFVIDGGIDTYNCFLLKCENDSREDWANLSWKAESCLMTGGGIGSDYSVYRPKNSVINRTGGLASGPVPKMKMINEIGREVMQGGSRRSAIYASLNWKHVDVHEFIHAKDWYNMKVSGTDLTIGDLKEKDFNFPAPLDMTNISVNYDTEWLENYKKTGDMGSVFLENAKQALSTGEPGFSFNFYEKEKETLRNAPVSSKTWILTKDGYVQISSTLGKEVEVWTGKQWAKTRFVKTKSQVNTIKVSMTGGREIEADFDHEFFVEKYSGKGKSRKMVSVVKVKARDLKIGDILYVSLPSKTEAYDEKSYTLGYIYGDGSFRKNSGGAELSLCTEDSKACLSSMDNSMFSSVNIEDSRGYTRVQVSAKALPMGREKSVFPYKDANLSFIAGLFDSDGCYSEEQNRVRLNSIHEDFLVGVRRSLETYGILSTITKAGVSTYGQSQGYCLVIMGSSIDLFSRIVPTNRLKVKSFKPYRESKVKITDLSLGDVQDVYCCDVKVPEHSFMAEGIIISNCTEVTSEDDSDVCNLGSLNFANIESKKELVEVVELAMKFLICGTMVADLPYEKVYKVREKNRRIGLGLMGLHEWLLKRNYKYEMTDELREWMTVYKNHSDYVSRTFSDRLGISRPVANRAIAPTGSIGILAGTTTSAEPLIAVAYKRRYLKGRSQWVYQYVVDGTARIMIDHFGINPDKIETALDLASDYERRIKFQADLQDYVDMSISSTINLPAWGSDLNNEGEIVNFAKVLAKYAHRLRGFTCYPDGARGGQPLTPVPYKEAILSVGQEFEEEFFDICDLTKGGVCGS